MIQYAIIFQGIEVIGPFETREAALEYIDSDWQGGEMQIAEIYPPDDSKEDRQQ